MKRYIIVDFMHLNYKYIKAMPLSATVKIGDELKIVDTTLPNYAIKDIVRCSGKGMFPTAVCLEGGSSDRKAYFSGEKSKDGQGYKGNRLQKQNDFYAGIDLAVDLMLRGGVSLYRSQGFEADDLVYSLVRKIKEGFVIPAHISKTGKDEVVPPDLTTPIDIITNDADLLPLVDEQVSVYARATRTYNEDGCPARTGYYQVTPNSWNEYFSYASAYKNFYIPYNSILLFKIIRGDSSDNVPMAVKGYGGKKYTALMQQMEIDGVDFATTFRYGKDFDTAYEPILSKYFTKDELANIKYVYEGINLRFTNLNLPKQIELGFLQAALSPLQIKIV